MLVAILTIIMGLCGVAFRDSAAAWAVDVDGKLSRTNISEKVYRTGFAVLGVLFVAFGALTVLLIA